MVPISKTQRAAKFILGLFMLIAGISHLTIQRTSFQAQVPGWVPLEKDLVVILSGIVEIGFGLALLLWKKQQATIGIALAIFYVLIFPGNIAQYVNHTDAFGLHTDKLRFIRLFFQPLLIAWALWCTGAWNKLMNKNHNYPQNRS